jgi:hypothetical protein
MDQGTIHLMANPQKLIAVILLTFLTGCSSFSMLLSGGSFAVSQNTYAKIYNAADMLTMMSTKKGIKTHAYEKGKKYIYDNTISLFGNKH